MQGGIGFTCSETGRRPLRFEMAHLLQARASMLRGKATGFHRVAPEMIMALPWEALRVSRQIFERRYMGLDPTSENFGRKKHHYPAANTREASDTPAGTSAHRAHWPSGNADAWSTCFSTNCLRNWGLRGVHLRVPGREGVRLKLLR